MRKKVSLFLFGKGFPLLMLLAFVGAFGIQLLRPGLFADDWLIAASFDRSGTITLTGFTSFAEAIMCRIMNIFGSNPRIWTVIGLFLRFVAGIFTWLILRELNPDNDTFNSCASLLFVLLPLFMHQPKVLSNFPLFLQLNIWLLSIWLMAVALHNNSKPKRILFLIASFLFALLQLAMSANLIWLELLRVPLIWILAGKRLLFVFTPYLYALFHFSSDFIDLYSPRIYLIETIKYAAELVWGLWYHALDPNNFELSVRYNQFALFAGLIFALIIISLLKKRKIEKPAKTLIVFTASALVLGFISMFLRNITPANSRYNVVIYLLPGYFGIALFLTLCMSHTRIFNILFACCMGICMSFQIRSYLQYRYSQKYQEQFTEQIRARIPGLTENTLVYGDKSPDEMSSSAAISGLLYEIYKTDGINFELINTEPFNNDKTLLLIMPADGHCLWVPDEIDVFNPYLSSAVRERIRNQNKSIILSGKSIDLSNDWCSFYEKADYSFDNGDFTKVKDLYNQALGQNISYKNPTEIRPFALAIAKLGDIETAENLISEAEERGGEFTREYFEELRKMIGSTNNAH